MWLVCRPVKLWTAASSCGVSFCIGSTVSCITSLGHQFNITPKNKRKESSYGSGDSAEGLSVI